jgi:hypothetical protein
MGLMIRNLYGGILESVNIRERSLTNDVLIRYKDLVRNYETDFVELTNLIRNGGEFYAKIHDGCRAGSIVKVKSNQFNIASTKHWHGGSVIHKAQITKLITAILERDYISGFKLTFQIPYLLCPNNYYKSRFKVSFDDGKTVGLSHDEQQSLEHLSGYVGPTVSCFTRTERTPEERAAMREPAQHKVFDQLGDEIQLGDLFLYGGANTLLIGKLVKVTEQGSLSYTSFVGGDTGRISTELVRKQVKKGEKVPCLLKYSKDLGERLMLFKLSN